MDSEKLKVHAGTVVRSVLLVVAIINSFCAAFGIIPENIIGDSEAYNIASQVITAALAAWNAWKNNSYTQNALKADEYLKTLKAGGVGADEGNAVTASTTKTEDSSNTKE